MLISTTTATIKNSTEKPIAKGFGGCDGGSGWATTEVDEGARAIVGNA